MTLTPSKLSLIILLCSFAIASCKKDKPSIGVEKKPIGKANISYFAKASGTGVKAAGKSVKVSSEQAAVTWSSASIYVEKISFIGTNTNLLDTTISVEKNVNLFSEEGLAGIIQLPVGSYKDVKVKMVLRKSQKSEMAFNLRGTFKNIIGGQDSLMVGSSYPFEANLAVPDLTISADENYKATFNFDLSKVLTGISTEQLQTARTYPDTGNGLMYVIWKGGSADEPFYDQVIANWQTLASVTISK